MTSSSAKQPSITTVLMTILWPLWPLSRPNLTLGAAIRALFFATLIQWPLFFAFLGGVNETKRFTATWVPPAIAIVGALDLLAMRKFMSKSPEGESAREVAAWFKAMTFLGYALSNAPVLYGFVGVFLTGQLWVYLVGLPFGAVGFRLCAPTESRIESLDSHLRVRGSVVRMVAVLAIPVGEITPYRPKRG